ncbi:hypothetical protein N7478_010186 [Penicillium angulare]|uniref:uncharacterized protein n=1 Tax=Penicillium angulare TaxID=116970 RepID=UPI00254113A2|nr:uncharacterized protein N7478_010186 [Penicillium angulare]KAJ5267378.1 hypothetical protein N7478_010186 [Penicillium angulare]
MGILAPFTITSIFTSSASVIGILGTQIPKVVEITTLNEETISRQLVVIIQTAGTIVAGEESAESAVGIGSDPVDTNLAEDIGKVWIDLFHLGVSAERTGN